MAPFNLKKIFTKSSKASKTPSSDTTKTPSPEPEIGIWACCHCSTENPFQLHTGTNPVGILECACQHKPCETCDISEPLKYFIPIQEPLTVPTPDAGHEVPYGIICGSCGESRRAEEVKRPKKILGIQSLKDRHLSRLVVPAAREGKLRKAKSMVVLRDTSYSDEDVEHEKEAEAKSMDIKFSGIKCTCGCISHLDTSFCFKVTEHETAELDVDDESEVGELGPSRFTNPELLAKGHHDPVIRTRVGVHFNPLRCNPVMPEDLI